MVAKIINFIGREIKGLHEAAYLLAIFSFFSLLLGLFRDRLLAGHFGASLTLDIYYASFRLPDLLFVIVTSLVSASVLVPIFSKHLSDKSELKKYIDSLFTIFFLIMVGVSVVTFIFVPQILRLTAPGLIRTEQAGQLILFTRVLLLSPILLGISQLFGGIVQAYRKFVLYAISPILYNIGIIIGIVFFYPIVGEIGLILGVCLGLVFHVLVQIPAIFKYSLLPKITLKIDKCLVRKVFSLSIPRTLTLASSQIILIVLIAIASNLETGSISVFNFAFNLQSVPLTIIGVSYSLAAFPKLSKLFHDKDLKTFNESVSIAVKHIVFWSIPVTVLFIILRAQIVRTILGSGEFSWSDTRLTAAALGLFIVSTLAQSLVLFFVKSYYATGQTRKPLLINLSSSIITISLSFFLVHIYQNNEQIRVFFNTLLRVQNGLSATVLMLPLAFSVGMIINATILWISFERNFLKLSSKIWRAFYQSTVASIFIGFSVYTTLNVLSHFLNINKLVGIFTQGLLAGLVGIIVGILILHIQNNQEIKDVYKTLHHRFWKTKPIIEGQEEL